MEGTQRFGSMWKCETTRTARNEGLPTLGAGLSYPANTLQLKTKLGGVSVGSPTNGQSTLYVLLPHDVPPGWIGFEHAE